MNLWQIREFIIDYGVINLITEFYYVSSRNFVLFLYDSKRYLIFFFLFVCFFGIGLHQELAATSMYDVSSNDRYFLIFFLGNREILLLYKFSH